MTNDSVVKELQCKGAKVEFRTSAPGKPAVSVSGQIINCLSLAGDDLSVLNSLFTVNKQPSTPRKQMMWLCARKKSLFMDNEICFHVILPHY